MSDPDLSPAASPADPDAPFESAAAPLASTRGYRQLEDVIADESFPEVDLALRRGRHIHKRDERWYEFLLEAQGHLEAFYRRYGCELEQRSDGYFFLLPISDSLGKRHLGVAEMIVGQGLALCYLDPQSVQSGGLVTREELLNQLAAVMGTDALMRSLNPKRKRVDERVMQRTVRNKVNDALRRLAQLGFVELLDAERLQLAPSLMRFAEPVRGLDAPSEALKRLIEKGEISLAPEDAEGEADPEESDLDEAEREAEDDEAKDEVEPAAASRAHADEPPAGADTADGAVARPFSADDLLTDLTDDGSLDAPGDAAFDAPDDASDAALDDAALDDAALAAARASTPSELAPGSGPARDGADDAAASETGGDALAAADPVLPPEIDFEWDSLPGGEPPGEEA